MILYYLLDGKPPWPYENGLVAVRKAAKEGDRPVMPRHWDERLQSLLQECWHEDQNVRPPFDEILKSLNEYSRDVFHTDSDAMATSTTISDSATGCNCSIM